jgi:hypothetical protein
MTSATGKRIKAVPLPRLPGLMALPAIALNGT